jgi:predicted amidohydrolase
VQTDLAWEDAETNRSALTRKFIPLKGTTDLVVLPEMFTTGFSMRSRELAETMDGPTIAWMREQASLLDAALYGSLIMHEDGRYTNRAIFMKPDGTFAWYDKKHLFRMGEENDHYTTGNKRVITEYRGWRILLQVCYDLRFPVFARNRGDHDLMLYVACWPSVRHYAWQHLLIGRAIENQSCVVGVNRVGVDGKGHHYAGGCTVLDALGHPPADLPRNENEWELTYALDAAALLALRKKFPVALDADPFTLGV